MNPRELWNRLERKEESNQTFSKIFFVALIIFILFLGIGRISFREFGIPLSFGKNVKNMLFWLLFFFLLKRAIKKDYSIPKTPVNLWMGLFASWIMITTYPDIWEAVKKIFPMACLYFALDSLDTKKQIHKFTIILLISACVATLIGFYNMFFLNKAMEEYRLIPPRGHPNILGGFLVLTLPLSINLFLNYKQSLKQSATYLVFIAIMAAGLLFTYSRGAWVGFLVAIMVLCLTRKRKVFLTGGVILALVALFVCGAYWLAPASDLGKRLETFRSLDRDPAFQARLPGWRASLEMIKDHPWMGIGAGKFRQIYPNYKPQEDEFILYHPHNSYLDIAVSFGIPGILLFSIICFVFFKTMITTFSTLHNPYLKSLLGGILAGIIGLMVNILAESLLTVDEAIASLFWLLFGLTFVIKKELTSIRHGS